MAQGVPTRGDTGGLSRPISMGPAAPMGPLPPGGFGAAPKVNPLKKPFPRGQQGIGGNSTGYDGEKKHWMKDAVKHPGALKKKAKAAGESTMEFARSHENAPGKAGKQARLAETFAKFRK